MTREQAKEAAMVMLAYANGEQVQVQLSDGSWIDFPINPDFDWQHVNYRIKPKPKSKYRPFVTKEECWNEMLKHQPFGFLSIADKHDYFSICRVFEEEGKPKIWLTNNAYGDCDMATAFVIFQFTDGTPFGIKEK